MSGARVYLDHNATAPLRPAARAAMIGALETVGNPSSVHREGREARALIEAAREQVACLIGAKPSEIVFTSGATEANDWVLSAGWDTMLVSGIEHDSVLAPAKRARARRVDLPVDRSGLVDLGGLADHIQVGSPPIGHTLASLQLANNETGVIQDVAAATDVCRAHGVASHCDAVQAAGRLPIDVRALGVDLMSLSAHKLGGPKGIGALYIRDGFDLPAQIIGGGQERRRRAGTENVAAIAGFGAAADDALSHLATVNRLGAMRDALEHEIQTLSDDAIIIGQDAPRLINTTCVAQPGIAAETLVIKLDLAGVAVSAGAACSSGKVGASHVLAAMGLPRAVARSAIRVSLGWTSSKNDLESFLSTWGAAVRLSNVQVPA